MRLIRKIILIVIPIVLLFNIVLYINTYVSEKYETQLEGIRDDISFAELEKRKSKIESQRRTIFITSVILSVVFAGLALKRRK